MICPCGVRSSDRLAELLESIARALDESDPATVGAIVELAGREFEKRACAHAIHAAAILDHLAVTLELGIEPAEVATQARRRSRAIRAAVRPPLTRAEVEETAALLDADDANPWAVLGIRADGA